MNKDSLNKMLLTEPNITIIENFVDNPNKLFVEIRDKTIWDERIKARKTASFGFSYNYSGITYSQTQMPKTLVCLCRKIERQLGFTVNNCLINYYLDGRSTMGYHSDSIEQLKEKTGVIIISLGSQRHISYRSKIDQQVKYKYLLKHGSFLYMNQKVQNNWMHAIPKENGVGERISLTFRHLTSS